MASLPAVLSEICDRIQKYRGRRLNEENTKAVLIDPVLRALGWNLEDLEEVQREYKVKRKDRPMDYALFRDREPVLIIEAKALKEDAGDRRWAQQVMGYATVAGVPWVLLTNGAEYRLYNALAPVPVDKKLFRSANVVDQPEQATDLLSLLEKARMGERDLDQLWQAYFVDQEVRAAIEDLFAPGNPDTSAINLVRKHTKNLSTKEVEASLTRMRFDLDFPQVVLPGKLPKAMKPKPQQTDSKGRHPKPVDVSLQDLITAGLLRAPLELEKTYRGKRLTARVERDGSVSFDGKSYEAISTAAGMARAKVLGTPSSEKPPATNGWTFWLFKNADGQLQEIGNLRQQHLRQQKLKIVG